MEITWTCLFLDCVESVADDAWDFWRRATSSTLAPARGEHGEFSTLAPKQGDAWLKLQRVGGAGGVHLDLHVVDRAGAVAEAVALGAGVRRELDDITVLASPGGFAFCVVEDAGARRVQVRDGLATIADQLTLDIPSEEYEAEGAFWAALTGWEQRPGSLPDFRSLARPPEIPVRVLLQRLEDPSGVVRGHPDFACRDLTAAVGEHQGMGSRPISGGRFWTVMEHPSAGVYCLTVRNPQTGTVG